MYRFAIFGRPTHLYSRIEEVQLQKHQSVMSNTAPAPYQYRILGELILEGLLKEGAQLGMQALTMMIILKMSLHFLIFLLSYLFFRQFQLGIGLSLFGVACTFYAILASYYNEDLVFYQYLEFIFFLAAFILILKKIDFWLIPLTFLAMLNKETSALIPFVYLINRLEFPKQGLWKSSKEFLVLIFVKNETFRKILPYFTVLLVVTIGLYAGLRFYFGTNREYITAAKPGWELLKLNFFHKYFYINWLVFFNFLLFTPWLHWNQKPAFIKRTAFVLFPFLILGNLFFGAMAEVRTFFCLLPLLLAASLINFDRWTREAGHATRNKLKA